jgi:hypothetical protein
LIKTDIGEYIVGAYLKVIKKCDFIDYNSRPPVGGLEDLTPLISSIRGELGRPGGYLRIITEFYSADGITRNNRRARELKLLARKTV